MAYKNFKKTEIIEELGIQLRRIRTTKKLTLSQVAEALNQRGIQISSIMLGRIETGVRRIDDDLFSALCEHYGVSTNEITIKACKEHISSMQNETGKGNSPSDITENDEELVVKTYSSLSKERQSDIKTMIRIFAYMDKFPNTDSK